MKTIVVSFPNHSVDNRAKFIFGSIAEALAIIESELEASDSNNEKELDIHVSFEEMSEEKFNGLPEFEGW